MNQTISSLLTDPPISSPTAEYANTAMDVIQFLMLMFYVFLKLKKRVANNEARLENNEARLKSMKNRLNEA